MQRVGDRARAVIARVLPLAVTAAVDVRRLGDLVARGDDLLDLLGRVGRRDGETIAAERGLEAGVNATVRGAVDPVPVEASPSTSERKRSMSAASVTPSGATCWSASNFLTLLTVPAPYSPSTDVVKPARLR